MNTTTMAARTSPDPKDFATMSMADLVKRYNAASDLGEKTVIESAMKKRWLKINIKVVKAQEGDDDVFVIVSAGGRSYESGYRTISSGGATTWWVSVEKIAPVTGHVNVKVCEYDRLDPNDTISNLGFDPPYGAVEDKRPWDDAEYHTSIEFDL
jgi:hypothetical protein